MQQHGQNMVYVFSFPSDTSVRNIMMDMSVESQDCGMSLFVGTKEDIGATTHQKAKDQYELHVVTNEIVNIFSESSSKEH